MLSVKILGLQRRAVKVTQTARSSLLSMFRIIIIMGKEERKSLCIYNINYKYIPHGIFNIIKHDFISKLQNLCFSIFQTVGACCSAGGTDVMVVVSTLMAAVVSLSPNMFLSKSPTLFKLVERHTGDKKYTLKYI